MILATKLYCIMYICIQVHISSAPYCWPLDRLLWMTASTTDVCHYSKLLWVVAHVFC